MKLSIIVPIYNIEKYIRSCIESVITQQYNDFELILIDDGSTDNSGNICEEYKNDERIKIIHKPNGGVSDARNKGLEIAQGNYIIFLDGDDQLYDNALNVINQYIEDDIDILFFTHNLLINEELKASKVYYTNSNTKFNEINKKLDLIFLNKNLNNWCIWNKVYSARFIKDNNFINDVNAYGCEDFDWIFKLILKSNYVKAINKPIINYRIDNVNSITKTKHYKRINNFLDYVIKWRKIINNSHLDADCRQRVKDVLSRQYISIIGYYSLFTKEEKQLIKYKIKEAKYFFNDTQNYEVKTIKALYNIVGLKITSKLIQLYKKYKREKENILFK